MNFKIVHRGCEDRLYYSSHVKRTINDCYSCELREKQQFAGAHALLESPSHKRGDEIWLRLRADSTLGARESADRSCLRYPKCPELSKRESGGRLFWLAGAKGGRQFDFKLLFLFLLLQLLNFCFGFGFGFVRSARDSPDFSFSFYNELTLLSISGPTSRSARPAGTQRL